jgi:hypothetical protein
MKQKTKFKILLFLLIGIECFVVLQWTQCTGFADHFHFSSFDLNLRLIESIHNDQGVPLWQVRLFHNKVTGAIFDVFAHYLQFWNLLFLTSLISLAGVIGLGVQFYYYFFKKKKALLSSLLLLTILLVPFVEIFYSQRIPFILRFMLLALPLVVWSVLGYRSLLMEKKINTKIIYVILLISFWYQLIPFLLQDKVQLLGFCH